LVVGGGLAGVAAAWQLTRKQQSVCLIWDGEGASSLYSGALDRVEWEDALAPRPIARDVMAFLEAFGVWAPPTARAIQLATAVGVLRPARGRDSALLDVSELRGRTVSVVDFGRPGWDAPLLSRALSEAAWSRDAQTRFQPLLVEAPDPDRARLLGDADFASCFDDPDWQATLADRLGQLGGGGPLLFGPWLGRRVGSAQALRQRLRRPLGETLSNVGGAAGLRFEAARDAWLAEASVTVVRANVSALERTERGLVVTGNLRGTERLEPIEGPFKAVVLAVGGVVGGGVRFLSGRPGPTGRSLSLSLDAPVALRLGGREVALQSGALGADLQRLGFDALTLVGLGVDERQRALPPDIFAAGDVVAARPRTALEAIYTGIEAARSACALTAQASR
jgi:glycerol-3-phosphate dehydrogenase subunit B